MVIFFSSFCLFISATVGLALKYCREHSCQQTLDNDQLNNKIVSVFFKKIERKSSARLITQICLYIQLQGFLSHETAQRSETEEIERLYWDT